MGQQENSYQAYLIKRLKKLLPGCEVLKNDEQYLQGVPDLLILYRDQWAMLEVKMSESSPFQPNQEHYINQFDSWSFAQVIYPENEEEILHELQSALRPRGTARIS